MRMGVFVEAADVFVVVNGKGVENVGQIVDVVVHHGIERKPGHGFLAKVQVDLWVPRQ